MSAASSSSASAPCSKKDMSQPMAGTYLPRAVESQWYDWWQSKGFFSADNSDPSKPNFVIVIPPPNVTGSLHLGHALTCSVQDTLIRWHRMQGHNTLWVPGTDHAGIATQVVVEKRLWADRQVTRHDLGREAFVQEVWKWKEEYGGRICNQLKRTGASVDWERQVFTMDAKLSTAVTEAFVRLYEKGLIYRDVRLVNWCCRLKTAISDIEVDFIELEKATKLQIPGYGDRKYEFGVLTSFAYKIEDSEEEIVVATTRPETMLGDTAIAVHPEDVRYKHLHGKFAVHPFNGRRVPIICDSVLVDPAFGTGAVKITPAHDPNDFECGKRHSLPMINVFTDEGLINENGGQFAGLKRFEAREAVVAELNKLKLFRGKQDNAMRLGKCSRSGDIIEPMMKPQWYCDCKGMAAKAAGAARDGSLKIKPEFHEDTWYRWLDNIRDWCISRQLWWGHRIPAYFVKLAGQTTVESANPEYWVVGRNREEAMEKAMKKFNISDASQIELSQDEDVLDTWFSSGLFPFSSFGWPNVTEDFKAFYPTSLLETGHDILFFWVARMVMMGMELTETLPFKEVYLHAMVRDKMGRKMSKSLGNVIDPIDVIEGITLEGLYGRLAGGNLDPREVEKAKQGQKEQFPNGIEECGTDALRFALVAYTMQGRDINLDVQRVVGYRNFCNKLWNATKFALTHMANDFTVPEALPLPSRDNLSFIDQWILSRLDYAISESNKAFTNYNFGDACTASYNFWLYELCDVYLEAIKPVMQADQSIAENVRRRKNAQSVLYTCVEQGLRLLHPIMPFVTEELWQRLPGRELVPEEKCSIMVQSYPTSQPEWRNETMEEQFKLLQAVIGRIRFMKAQYSLTYAQRPEVAVRCRTAESLALISAESLLIRTLGACGDLTAIDGAAEAPEGSAVEVVNDTCDAFVKLAGLIDISSEVGKIQKKHDKLVQQKEAMIKKTQMANYETKVPADVREQNAQRLESMETELSSMIAAMESLKKISQ